VQAAKATGSAPIETVTTPAAASSFSSWLSSASKVGKKAAAMELVVKADGELADADEESLASALILMPPSVSRKMEWLVVTCHAADGLPAMDDATLFTSAGIDAYAQVTFGGNPPARTQWIHRTGSGNLKVEWNRELWLPFLKPNFTNRVEVAVYDYDLLKEDDRVGECPCPALLRCLPSAAAVLSCLGVAPIVWLQAPSCSI